MNLLCKLHLVLRLRGDGKSNEPNPDTARKFGGDLGELARHPCDHITVTVVLYHTLAGAFPTENDVISAIDDLESLYQRKI